MASPITPAIPLNSMSLELYNTVLGHLYGVASKSVPREAPSYLNTLVVEDNFDLEKLLEQVEIEHEVKRKDIPNHVGLIMEVSAGSSGKKMLVFRPIYDEPFSELNSVHAQEFSNRMAHYGHVLK